MSLALSSSPLQQEFMVSLVVSNCSRALFICSYSWSSPSGSLADLTLEGAWGLWDKGKASCLWCFWCGWLGWQVSNTGEAGDVFRCGSLQGHLCRDCHGERGGWVHLIWPEGILCLLVEGGTPRATDGGSILSLLHWYMGVEAAGEVCCRCSKALWSCKLMTMAMSLGGLVVSVGEGATPVWGWEPGWQLLYPQAGCSRGTPLSVVGPRWVYPWWQHSRAAAPERWTAEPQAPHLALLSIPPSPCVAVIFVLATDRADCRH